MLCLKKKFFSNFTILLFNIIFVADFRNFLDVNAQTSKLSPIQIVNITDEYKVFNAGEELLLICKWNGSEDLHWISTTEDPEQEDDSIPEFDDKTNTYSAMLSISNASYLNTGSYKCANEDETVMSLVYVFVNDTNHIFLNPPNKKIENPSPNKNVIIPCRATSPDIKFNLKRNGIKAPNFISYDHQRGATVYLNGTLEEEIYTCIGLNMFNRTEDLEIIVRNKKPTPKRPTLKDESDSHFVGHQLKLSCMVKLDNNLEIWWWNLPSKVKQNDSRLQFNNFTNGPEGNITLTLTNLSIEDNGNYTCYFENNSQNQTITIKVKDKPYIYLKSDSALEPVSANVTEQVIFIVDMDAYPRVKEYVWLFNNNKITPSTNYRIKNSSKEAELIISSVSLKDDGQYMLRATNGVVNQTIDITLKVLQKPSVSITGPSYILLDNKKNFYCTAVGNPIPEIHWSFKKCAPNEKCSSEPILNKASEVTVNSFKNTSTYILKTNVSGTLICEANNSGGSDSSLKEVLITDIPEGDDGFNAWKEIDDVSVGDSVVLYCGASNNHSERLEWYLNNSNTPLKSNDGYKIVNISTLYSYRKNIEIFNITKDYNGNYKCEMNGSQANSVELNIVDTRFPVIHTTNLKNGTEIKLPERKTYEYNCHAEGMPIPIITWKKDNKLLKPDQKRIKISKDNKTLIFKYTLKNDTGLYTCEVSNRLGTIITESKLIIGGGTGNSNKISRWIIIVPIVCIIILIISIIFIYIKLRDEKRQIAEFENAGLNHFEEGDVECINPNLAIDDQADLLPYYNEWEFPTEKLKLGKVLGAGAFGVVVKAEAQGIIDGEDSTLVAVKMFKKNADMIYVKALVSELKIMVHLGRHVNVVNLLGACTKNLVSKRELLVIVEYCRYGNLLNYLQRHRRDFVNQIDPSTGDFNTSIGVDVDGFRRRWSKNVNSPIHTTVSFFNRTVAGVDYRAEPEISNLQYSDVPTTPFDKRRDTVVSNKSEQPEWRSNYQADYYDHKAPLCSKDLLCWAFQIARGMEYLVSRRVLHGDLAARNVLVAENNIVKICDFGLAKSIYKDSNYVRKKNCPLPVKWMALESIRDQIFSVQSDVWSYGVVLWELFSLGQTPYSEIVDFVDTFYEKLEDGYRLQKPEFATKKIYQIMLQCWEVRPKNRPLFDKLVNDVGMMLENADREHYTNLNNPYLMMNDMKIKDHKDYLAMMSTPDFEKFSSTNHYINALPTTSNSASLNKNNSRDSNNEYVCMRPLTVFNSLDDSIKTENLPMDADSSEITPMLSLNITSDTKNDIKSDGELTTPDYKNINENNILNPTYHISTIAESSITDL